MTTYAIALTFVLGLVLGVIANNLFQEFLASRDEKRRNPKEKVLSDDEQMDLAEKLVSEELGATVISKQ